MCAKLFLSLHGYVQPVLLMYSACVLLHVLIVHMVISTPEKVQIRDPDPRPEYQSDALTIKPFGPLADQRKTSSGGFRAARLPGQATCAARAGSLWVEKNPVLPPNRRALDWSVVLTVGRLCPIVPQDNIVVSNKHN